jgi:hypothetical protein
VVAEAHKRKAEAATALAILRERIPDYDARVSGAEVARVDAVGKNGGDRQSEQFDNVKLKAKGSNSKNYLIARLKRDSAEDPNARRLRIAGNPAISTGNRASARRRTALFDSGLPLA